MACGNLVLTLVGEMEDFADRGFRLYPKRWYVREEGVEKKIRTQKRETMRKINFFHYAIFIYLFKIYNLHLISE